MPKEALKNKFNDIVDLALREDLGSTGDITSNLTIPENKVVSFQITNRQDILLCGVDMALEVFSKVNSGNNLDIKKHFNDGDFLEKQSVIISGSGSARTIFAAERIALNLMQHLSGIATKTNEYVKEAQGNCQILDTRKTIPALRELQKYGVKVGGGKNHRMALYDGILIKDNHIAAAGGVKEAVEAVKSGIKGDMLIEVECDNLEQVKQALEALVDIIMLDNMNLETIERAVKLINKKAKIEVSGNITLSRIKEISALGVDYISVGALTHSVKAVDIGLDIIS